MKIFQQTSGLKTLTIEITKSGCLSVLFSDFAFGFLWLSSKKVHNNSKFFFNNSILFMNWCAEENLEVNNKDN